MARKILVTGSNGLIGSEVCVFFSKRDFQVYGLDNNQRAVFSVLREIRDGTNAVSSKLFLIIPTTNSISGSELE
jgi:nucleoside-diphosphate-sugar epimerase